MPNPNLMKSSKITRLFRVEPGSKFRCKDHRTDYREAGKLAKELGLTKEDDLKEEAKAILEKNLGDLSAAQERLYASDRFSVLIIFQAMDTAGKDGMIKHVMSGLNPQGCQVSSFGRPSEEELQHSFLWRCAKRVPERGNIGIFNRSYYEDVLVVRVHPELLQSQKFLDEAPDKEFWDNRYQDINHFERHLSRNGTRVLKFFLHISRREQKKRLLERLDDPRKHWKFDPGDLVERARWPEYIDAFDKAITATSTPWAPWYVIPADQKWVARAAVSAIIGHEIDSLNLELPVSTPERLKELAKARRTLLAEK